MKTLQNRLPGNVFALWILTCGLGACSSSSGSDVGTGGATGPGGAPTVGGSIATGGMTSTGGNRATGGVTSTGGTLATGGVTSTGGNRATGGVTSTGGNRATGGATTTGGTGVLATGGTPVGGGNVGGSNASGGTVAGGAPSGGRGGASSGGAAIGGAVAGGAAGSPGKASPGCSAATPLKTGNFTETIDGVSRKWMLDVPSGYDATKPYKLIFVWHPLGGSGSQVVSGGYNGLKSLSNSTTIFATADGLQGSNSETSGVGWWNANGGDMKLVQIMLDKINAGLCVDQDRIFSTGFSFGGMMSYTLPFEFNVFRAVAPCSGKTGVIPYTEKFTGPVPIMAFHGDADTFVATALGKAFLDKFAARNKCGTQTQAVSPSGCVQYQGCTVPTIWCVFPGGHTTWSEEPAAIWKFFSQF